MVMIMFEQVCVNEREQGVDVPSSSAFHIWYEHFRFLITFCRFRLPFHKAASGISRHIWLQNCIDWNLMY